MRFPSKLAIFFEKTIKTAVTIVFDGLKCKNGYKSIDLQPFLLWSCGESNPGPNEEAIRFLHAYPRFGFRMKNGSRPPIFTLSPLFHRLAGAFSRLFPILLHFLFGPLRINSTREMSHSSI